MDPSDQCLAQWRQFVSGIPQAPLGEGPLAARHRRQKGSQQVVILNRTSGSDAGGQAARPVEHPVQLDGVRRAAVTLWCGSYTQAIETIGIFQTEQRDDLQIRRQRFLFGLDRAAKGREHSRARLGRICSTLVQHGRQEKHRICRSAGVNSPGQFLSQSDGRRRLHDLCFANLFALVVCTLAAGPLLTWFSAGFLLYGIQTRTRRSLASFFRSASTGLDRSEPAHIAAGWGQSIYIVVCQ